MISAALHAAVVGFAVLSFVFPPEKTDKVDVEVRILENPKVAPKAVDLTQPSVAPPPPQAPARKVFGVSRKALTAESPEASGVALKQGNTVAVAPDDQKLEDSDADSLPIPVDEYLITKPPTLLEARKPLYPAAARERGIQGAVRVEILIDANGRVREARVLKGLGFGTDEAALESARQLRFTPAEISGKPVAVKIQFKINFELE